MPQSRYDVYGFRSLDLDAAAAHVEAALDLELRRRDSMYRGIYYCGGTAAQEYLLTVNDEEERWHDAFPDYSVILQVSALPNMDAIRDRLTTGHAEPVLLHTFVQDEPDDDADDDDRDDDTRGGDRD